MNREWKIVWQEVIDVFGSSESASIWMNTEIRSLGGVAPISLLSTEEGRTLVSDTLGRIKAGICA